MLERPASLPTAISFRVTLMGTGSFHAGTDFSPTRGRRRAWERPAGVRGRQVGRRRGASQTNPRSLTDRSAGSSTL